MLNRSCWSVKTTAGSKMAPEFELTDEQWNLISDLFPSKTVGPKGGRPPWDARDCVEGILWILRTGARWRDLPSRFPSHPTCWRRLKEWTEAGVWEKAWGRLLRVLDRRGAIDREESMADGTFSSAKKGANVLARPNVARAQKPWFSLTVTEFRCRRSLPAPVLPKSL